MTKQDTKALSDVMFDAVSQNTDLAKSAVDAVGNYTRLKMYRLNHIPTRYFVNAALGEHCTDPTSLKRTAKEEMRILVKALAEKGCIDLDADGQPACLSGKPAVLAEETS